MIYIINKVVIKENVYEITKVISYNRLEALKKLLDVEEGILKKYGICNNTNKIKNGMVFRYKNELVLLVFEEKSLTDLSNENTNS